MNINVIYGTETGNAEMVADDIVEALSADFAIDSTDMSKLSTADISADTFYFVICSTYGDGELPNSALPFFEQLERNQPDLNGVRFAIFGLGDSFYATYNKGSELIARALTSLGAAQVGERGLHDATSGDLPGDVALPWAKQVLSDL
ncbi:Cindoxin [compost metagenome]